MRTILIELNGCLIAAECIEAVGPHREGEVRIFFRGRPEPMDFVFASPALRNISLATLKADWREAMARAAEVLQQPRPATGKVRKK